MAGVFPTHVGVFPFFQETLRGEPGLPHARGGVSGQGLKIFVLTPSSPPPWGHAENPIFLEG